MNHLAAVVLLHLGGKSIDEKSVTAVIEAAGSKADAAKVKQIVEAVKGKDVMTVKIKIIKKIKLLNL